MNPSQLFALCAVICTLGAPAMAQTLQACPHPAPPPGSTTVTSPQGPVIAARYFGATQDYAHGILGDTIEAKGLVVQYQAAAQVFCHAIEAGPNRVFEDASPRLADLDGDGLNEIIVVASHKDQGARLEVYGYAVQGQPLQMIAATPYIGRSHRWLAPIGAADLDGDGAMEIAYIDRPHLAKTLRIWRYEDRRLTEVAQQAGFTNHKIGWPMIPGGIRDCGEIPEMVVATADWSSIAAVRFTNGEIKAQRIGAYSGPDSLQDALRCP